MFISSPLAEVIHNLLQQQHYDEGKNDQIKFSFQLVVSQIVRQAKLSPHFVKTLTINIVIINWTVGVMDVYSLKKDCLTYNNVACSEFQTYEHLITWYIDIAHTLKLYYIISADT